MEACRSAGFVSKKLEESQPMLATHFQKDPWDLGTSLPSSISWILKSKGARKESLFGLNIHLLAQVSSKKGICTDSPSSSMLSFNVNDKLTLSCINSQICVLPFFLFLTFKKVFHKP